MKLLPAIALVLAPIFSFGQLITNTAPTAASLVQNVFAGNGVTITNVTFNGNPASLGSFTANGTNLGMTSGIVMTTGAASHTNPDGPAGPNTVENAGVDLNGPGYAPLSSLVGGTATYDASVLQFDFQTCSDSVRFKYVFGSEEYLEYVGSQFNDVFAFFISGPGIAGSPNIATLPNGQAVAINNVHSAASNAYGNFGPANSQYYVNNANGATIQYDGFTKVLTAEAAVQCDQIYHLVIAIADVGDGQWDSGIFLEANSFNSKTPVEVSHQLSVNSFNNPDILAESCASTTVTLDRIPCNIGTAMTVPITVSGTATEGVDYSNIPATITIPAGSQQTQFTIDAFQDGLAEGQESLTLTFHVTDNCGNTTDLVLNLFINDIEPVQIDIQAPNVNCPGEQIELVATATGGAPPYSYLWNNGATTSSIFVSPTTTTTYTVTVTDDCLGQPVTQSYTVVVPVIPPLVIDNIPDITEICPYLPATLDAVVSGGTPPYTYSWSSNFSSGLGTGSSYTAVPSTTTTYTVTVTDLCGQVSTESMLYTITSPPLVLEMSPDIEICPGDSAFISVNPSGGWGAYYYNWLHSGETTQGVWVKPGQTTSYTVSVSDECQTFTVEGNTRVIVVKPTADFYATSTTFFNGMPVTFHNTSINASTYEWDFGDGNTDTFIHPQNTYADPGLYYITLIAIDDKGCRDTIVKPINIEEEWWIYVPNTFTPDGDRFNNDFRISTIGIESLSIGIFNRWGELIFEAHDQDFVWDGTYDGMVIQDGTHTYKIDFITNSGRERTILGHVNIIK